MKEWHRRKKPSEITAIPWLAEDAIKYFASLLRPDMNVIEFGAGGSTLWLAERVQSVTTYENNADFIRELSPRFPDNVMLWQTGEPPIAGKYDLAFIDGEPVQLRGKWLQIAPHIVKQGGYVVLDNSNRPEYENERKEFLSFAELLYDVHSTGGRYFKTEFFRVNHS